MIRPGVLALAALGGLIALRISTLAPPALVPGGAPGEVQELFHGLTQSGRLTVGAHAQLVLPEPDLALAADYRGEPLDAESQRLLRDLDGSAAGVALRGQITLWNRGRRLSAVRDDGAAGRLKVGWRAHDCTDGHLLASGAPVSEAFGYIHQGRLQTGLGEWTAANAPADCIEWRAELRAPKPAPLRILFIGRPLPGSDGQIRTYDPPPSDPPDPPRVCLGPVPGAQAGESRIPESAWRRTPDHRWAVELRLRLAPAENPSLSPQGLRVGVTDGATDHPVGSAARTNDRCARPTAETKVGATNHCQPAWHPPPTGAPGLPATWQIETADGHLLAADTRPTPAAQALGLIPLVGFGGPQDYRGLGQGLRHLHPGGTLRLTIDGRLQAAARTALNEGIADLPPVAHPEREQRRAVLVLLDTDGAILAAVGQPEPPPLAGVTEWDWAAFARVYPLDDPLQVRAWEGGDRHQAPGSTFKSAIALAGLFAADQDPQVRGVLAGLEPAPFKALTGLGLEATEIDPYAGVAGGHPGRVRDKIKNFKNDAGRIETLGDLQGASKLLSQGCPGQAPGRGDLGLSSALRDSLNIWFAALALRLDGKAADDFQNLRGPLCRRPLPDLKLLHTLRLLGFGERDALFAAPPAGLAGGGPHMSADQLYLDKLGKEPIDVRLALAETAIGQGLQVTPLRMAALAASLARGARVRPHLDAAWNGTPVRPPVAPPWGLKLDLLHRGMRAVVQVGTAHVAFSKSPPAVRCHTYAKTGTAQIGTRSGGRESYNSAWLIGWHQPPAAGPALAFACLVTQVRGENATGGAVCGPIIARLLERRADPELSAAPPP